jgi:hypothetical protein
MIDKLFEIAPQLDIRILTLTSGKTVIGEYCLIDAENDAIRLHCPMQIKQICSSSSIFSEIFVPLISNSDDESCIVYHAAIESMMNASLDIKNRYIESLIINRANAFMMLYESEHSDNLFDPSLELVKQLSL